MFKLSFYVPESHSEKVKQACFDAGAGRIGHYDMCCWQTAGQGQFRPLDGSHPSIGVQGQLETLSELKIEMVCADEHRDAVVEALKSIHPYEEVAYAVIPLSEPD